MVSIPHARLIVIAAALAAAGTAVVTAFAASATASTSARGAVAAPSPPRRLTAHRLRPRADALAPGSTVTASNLFGDRVFANASDGFALADGSSAQYPAVTADGGRSWRIDGPQLHVDAADGPESVGYVGVVGPRAFYAYGSSVVDVTTNAGRTWWETFLGELVMAVVPGTHAHELVAYVQQSVSSDRTNPVRTSQYVSRDGGRHWRYSSALGG